MPADADDSNATITGALEHLDALHHDIAQALFDALEDEKVEWDDARIMVTYRDGDDFQWALRFRKNGERSSLRVTPSLDDLTRSYRPTYNDLTGLDLRRLRLTLRPNGRFTVDYFYDLPERSAKWDWPDE